MQYVLLEVSPRVGTLRSRAIARRSVVGSAFGEQPLTRRSTRRFVKAAPPRELSHAAPSTRTDGGEGGTPCNTVRYMQLLSVASVVIGSATCHSTCGCDEGLNQF